MNNKYIVLIPIAIIAIIMSAIIIRLFIIDDKKPTPFLHIEEPAGSVSVKKGESFIVKGKTVPYGMLVFDLKTGDSSSKAPGWNTIELKVDNPSGEFAQDIKIPDNIDPGNYIINVSLGKLSDHREVKIVGDVISPPPIAALKKPPYFVYRDNRVSIITTNRNQPLTIEVIDDDGDLNSVWNEVFPQGISKYTLMLPWASITGDSIIIAATDLAGNRSSLLIKISDSETDKEKPVFYVNDQPQVDGTSIILNTRNLQKVEIRDNKSIGKIDRKIVDTPKYEFTPEELKKLPEGANKITATDKGGNSSSITLVRDLTPPRISKESPIYMRPDSSERIKFSDDNGLFEVAGTAIIGKEYELVIYSDSLKMGENKFYAYDIAGNMSTLLIIKGEPLKAKIISPSVSPFMVKSDNIKITLEIKGGQGQRSVVINNSPTAVDPGIGTANINVRLQEGLNRLSIFAKDDVDNLNLGTIDIFKDTKPPVIDSIDGDSVGERIWLIKKSGDNLHKISIKDDSGIDKVTLNGSNVRVETGVDKTSVAFISDKNLKSSGNELVILDKVGNELKRSIEIMEIKDQKGTLENIKKLIEARNYAQAEELVKQYEKIQSGPTANLFKGMINYGKGEYNKSIEDLNKAYQERERYDRGSLNVEYNLLYLGLSYYEQWRNKANVESSNKALLNLGMLNNPDVQSRSPEIYEKARSVINSIEAAQRGRSR